MSGAKRQRPGLEEALQYAREGGTIVVWRLDRLGRNMQDLIQIVNNLNERGIGFQSLQENMTMSDESLENKKQHKGNSCKNRFCPICSWKKARKDALALSIMMEYIKEEHEKDFMFLTLTTPNVTADKLHEEIKQYNKSFQKLVKRTEVKRIIKGYARKLEVTYDNHSIISKKMYKQRQAYYDLRGLSVGDNNPNYDTYNPHFHVLIAVNKSYFTDKNYYINRNRWLELWQESTNNTGITQVDVRKVRENSKKEVSELAKYSAKDSDYLVDEIVFEAFYKSLKGKRLIVYSGLFKDALKKFKNGELDKYKEKTEYVYALMYNWEKKTMF
jgi:plasmid rolling circle replication initiator protein Rep